MCKSRRGVDVVGTAHGGARQLWLCGVPTVCVDCRVTSGGEYIPVAPLECCGLCLGDKIHDKTNCEDLNFCSNNGICTLGACECFEGYCGPDCSVHSGDGGGGEPYGIPWWATLLVVAGSACVLSCSSIAVRYAFYTVRDARGGERGPGAWGEVKGVIQIGLLSSFTWDPVRSGCRTTPGIDPVYRCSGAFIDVEYTQLSSMPGRACFPAAGWPSFGLDPETRYSPTIPAGGRHRPPCNQPTSPPLPHLTCSPCLPSGNPPAFHRRA